MSASHQEIELDDLLTAIESGDDPVAHGEPREIGSNENDEPAEKEPAQENHEQEDEEKHQEDEQEDDFIESEVSQDRKSGTDAGNDTSKNDASKQSDSAKQDEYGNAIKPEKTYTQAEVNKMMRERAARGQQPVQQPVAQPQYTTQQQQVADQAKESFTPDPNSSDDWETQLENFVDKAIDRVTTRKQKESEQNEMKARENEFRAREDAAQADFEHKFSAGMQNYDDFVKVIGKLPITDNMMLGTRTLPNPAAFLYAAAKMQPEELKRIAAIPDRLAQVAEIARLDERMKKAKNITNASRPLSPTPRGSGANMGNNDVSNDNIDAIIAKDQRQRFSKK